MSDQNFDFLDDVFMAENRIYEEGFQKGFIQGQKNGYQNGYVMGAQKGAEIGAEIGFYQGFVETWILLVDRYEEKSRTIHALEALQYLLNEIVLDDPTDESLFEKLNQIRAKFKQVSSLLNLSLTNETASSEKVTGFSF